MYTNKILYGFSDVYVCKDDETPIPIKGAVNILITIENDNNDATYAYIQGLPAVLFSNNGSSTCKGEMEILGLNTEEQQILLGYEIDDNGGVKVSDKKSPLLHLLFSRECADGSKQLYHVYNVRFSAQNLEANTMIEGNITSDNLKLTLDITYNKTYESYYYTLNSKDNPTLANKWFTELIYPK